MSLPSHLQGLNPEQLEAVRHLEGPLLVLAGAGSGKTRVLTRRVAHLVHEGVRPWQILAVTFTNKAAQEMRERVGELVGDAAQRIVVSTFHSACARFLRREAPRLGYSSSFVIYDDDDQKRLVRDILRELQIDPKRYPPKAYLGRIDQAKNRLLGPEEVSRGLLGDPGAMAMRVDEVYERYQKALVASNAFDFNDLVGRMVQLLEQDTEVRERYRDRFRYLLVDEYQDTNHAQYRLIKALAGREPHNLAVVGDDDQSIYAFRGADIRNILDFERDFPQVKTIRLECNYRSTGNILELAGSLVQHNTQRKDKTLWTEAPAGDPVFAVVGNDEEDEAQKVVDEIGRQMRSGRRPGDVAIFYRTHASSRPLEQALGAARIPHVVVGGRRFYERREVRDMVAWLRLMVNPTDSMALLRIINVPPRGIGASSVGRLREGAEEAGVPMLEAARRGAREGRGRAAKAMKGFIELYDRLLDEARDLPTPQLVMRVAELTGYLESLRAEESEEAQGRIENIEALARAARSADDALPLETPPSERLRSFLDQATLASADQDLPDHDGQVTLMTVHLAKGLEFPLVFVVGLVEKVFPHARSDQRLEDIEEERRLAYVAFTRARERLYLCRPLRRWVRDGGGWSGGGRIAHARPSPFLKELPQRLVRPLGRPELQRAARPVPPPLPSASTRKLDALLAQVRARDEASGGAPPPGGVTMVPESPDVFRPGLRVRHAVFGDGEIRRLEGRGPTMKLIVFFQRFGNKKLRVREARLEVLVD